MYMATKKEKLKAIAKKWDAAKHPRYPAGHPKGGKFMPKGSVDYSAAMSKSEKHSADDPVSLIASEFVGKSSREAYRGATDAWNKQSDLRKRFPSAGDLFEAVSARMNDMEEMPPEPAKPVAKKEKKGGATKTEKLKAVAQKVKQEKAEKKPEPKVEKQKQEESKPSPQQVGKVNSSGLLVIDKEKTGGIGSDPHNDGAESYVKSPSIEDRIRQYKQSGEKHQQKVAELGAQAFASAPADMAALVQRVGHPEILEPEQSNGSWMRASPASNPAVSISPRHVNPDSDLSPARQDYERKLSEEVYIHEWGHFLDAAMGDRSSKRLAIQFNGDTRSLFRESEVVASAMKKDSSGFDLDEYDRRKDEVVLALGKLKEKLKEKRQELGLPGTSGVMGLPSAEETAHLAHIRTIAEDCFCALSKGKFGYGHDAGYYSIEGKPEAEIIAQFAVFASSPYPEVRKLPEVVAPEMWKAWKKRIKERIGVDFDR